MDRRPLRIAIACYPTAGGSGVVATELGRALHARGHDIHFVASSKPFRFPGDGERMRFHPVTIPSYYVFQIPSYGMSTACVLSDIAERYAIDLFHVHYAYPHAVSGFLANQMTRGRNPAVVTTLHGTDIPLAREQPCHERLVRFALEQSHGITAVSGYLAEETRRIFDLDRDIRVVHNWVDPEAFRPAISDDVRRGFAPAGELLIVHVSNFRPIKRPIDVIETFRAVRAELPARLLLVGDGPELPAVREHAARCGLAADVIYAGERRDLAETVAAGDLFLLTSEHEGFGLAALEAMACGLPVVASRCGGIQEVVRDGQDGFLAPVGQVSALAAACVRLGRDPELRLRLGASARRRAVESFGPDRGVRAYEDYYYEVLERVGSTADCRSGAV